jgi:hypothetical protein
MLTASLLKKNPCSMSCEMVGAVARYGNMSFLLQRLKFAVHDYLA